MQQPRVCHLQSTGAFHRLARHRCASCLGCSSSRSHSVISQAVVISGIDSLGPSCRQPLLEQAPALSAHGTGRVQTCQSTASLKEQVSNVAWMCGVRFRVVDTTCIAIASEGLPSACTTLECRKPPKTVLVPLQSTPKPTLPNCTLQNHEQQASGHLRQATKRPSWLPALRAGEAAPMLNNSKRLSLSLSHGLSPSD